ncbi:MAG: pantoate--beta-alanine ligase [Desulfovibrionaceae bacterium]|nr:pantoate--beta-alanine ligase [Desulfovibrionaceae bacterium]MBF0512568.1 pantoate--beta-alanine ligase [Desulfovibrionaceae bacterium]
MDIISDPAAFQRVCWFWRLSGAKTALVPTMGFLHAGHASLLEAGRERADKVALSVFVNPSQFGPGEDFERYPRDPGRDAALAEAAGVDVMFTPEPGAMYPPGFATWVDVPELAKGLCGGSRPGHFRGVATIVAKLLMLSLPSMAIFGQKDWQQLAILKRLTQDLGFPAEIVGLPTVREPDGLALSSRNVYLSEAERAQAPALYEGLRLLRDWVRGGQTGAEALTARLRAWCGERAPLGEIDYLEIVDPDSLTPLGQVGDRALAAAAMRFGRTRLIDNLLLSPAG